MSLSNSSSEHITAQQDFKLEPGSSEIHENSNIADSKQVIIADEDEKRDSKCSCCNPLKHSCHNFWKPLRTKYNPVPKNAPIQRKLKYAFMCPPHGTLGIFLQLSISFALVWGVLISLTEDEALPGGQIFAVVVMFVGCIIGGFLISLIKLPPLLGMLIVGGMLRNVPKIDISTDISKEWSGALRQIALTVILTRAGLGLDPVALKKLSFVVIRLAFSPCLAETIALGIASHLLMDIPWLWGFLMGFVVAAVSPAVVVPSLLSLSDRGYGIDKGVPTLVMAAASIDDVIAITGFGVLLGVIFSQGNIAFTVVKGPLEALLGIAYGSVFGVVTWYVPAKDSKNIVLYRCILLFGGGLLAIFGAMLVDLPGAGPLGCLTMSFVAALKWRKEGWTDDNSPVQDVVDILWMIFQPLLFGLIGSEIQISHLKADTIGMGLASIAIALGIRMVVSFLAVFGSGLNLKEKLFIPFAWLPKATVQAAIGAVALDTARKSTSDNAENIELGEKVLTIAVLVILITAPIGAIAIAIAGPLFLHRTVKKQYINLEDDKGKTDKDVEIQDGNIEQELSSDQGNIEEN